MLSVATIENDSQNICVPVNALSTTCWQQRWAVPYYMHTNGGTLSKLKDTTFVLGSKPMRALLWCDVQKRAKRNKPAKINGIIVTNTVEVFHEV